MNLKSILLIAALAVSTQVASKELTLQQQKMVTCNKQAKDYEYKSNQRKQFMRNCLSSKKTPINSKKVLLQKQKRVH